MAKAPSTPTGTSRIRFVMLDAEVPNGDVEQIMQAIQTALRPNVVVQQKLVQAGTFAPPLQIAQARDDRAEEPDFSEDGDAVIEATSPKTVPKERGPRKLTVPKVIELDLTSSPDWESYAKQKNPTTDADKFLVVAAWFKEHRSQDAITANHVYTCFRAIKWPTAIDDFSGPLRHLKSRQLMTSAGRGLYSLNHLGLARVDKLGGG